MNKKYENKKIFVLCGIVTIFVQNFDKTNEEDN